MHLKRFLGNLSLVNPRVWRFLPIGDPTVSKFICRDGENKLSLRERVAVLEWENSNLTLHVIRDSPGHSVEILAGLWGFKNENVPRRDRKKLQKTLMKVLQAILFKINTLFNQTQKRKERNLN